MIKNTNDLKDKPIHPGKYIKDNILTKKGITQKALGDILGVSRQTINNLVQENIKLTPAMAFRLSSISQSVDFWLNMQKTYEQSNSSKDSKQNLLELWESLGTRTLVDHEIISGLKNDIVGIENYSEESIQPASYDLRAGTEAIVTSENSGLIFLEKTPLVLHPHEIAILRTYEKMKFPNYILGRLGSMTRLCQHGIVTMAGIHVDPGFEGHLYVTISNIGNNLFQIEFKDPFLSVEFQYLSTRPERIYQGLNKNRESFLDEELKTVSKLSTDSEIDETEFSTEEIKAAIQFLKATKNS